MKLGFLYDIEEYWIVEACTNGLHLLYAKILNKMFNVIIFLLFIQVKSCVICERETKYKIHSI